jgi:hypothetical protein
VNPLRAVSFLALASSLPAQMPRSDTTVIVVGTPRYAAGATLGQPRTIVDTSAGASSVHQFFVGSNGAVWLIDTPAGPGRKTRLRVFDSVGRASPEVPITGAPPYDFAELKDGRVALRGGMVGRQAVFDGWDHVIRVFRPNGVLDTTWSILSDALGPNYGRNNGLAVDARGNLLVPFDRSQVRRDRPREPASFVLRLRPTDGAVLDTLVDSLLPRFYYLPGAAPVALVGVLKGNFLQTSSAPTDGRTLHIDLRPTSSLDTPYAPIISLRWTVPLTGSTERWQSPTISMDGDLWARSLKGIVKCPTPPAGVRPRGGGGAATAGVSPQDAEPVCPRYSYRVADTTGAYIGDVFLPDGILELVAFRRDAVWVMRREAAGRMMVARYALTWR